MTEDSSKQNTNRRENRPDFLSRLAQKKLQLKLAIAKATGRADKMQNMHVDHWRTVGGDSYYERVGVRFQEWFLGPHQPFVQAIEKLAQDHPFVSMVEVGCGDGQVLNAFCDKLTNIPQFIGMDVNDEIIARNSKTYANTPKLQFTAEDFTKTYKSHIAERVLYLSYGGVLEYFSQADLDRILAGIARPGCAFGLVEPVDADHELETQASSYPFGYETSFSHNHRALFERAGWVVTYDEEVRIAGIRFKMLIAQIN